RHDDPELVLCPDVAVLVLAIELLHLVIGEHADGPKLARDEHRFDRLRLRRERSIHTVHSRSSGPILLGRCSSIRAIASLSCFLSASRTSSGFGGVGRLRMI